MAKSDSGRWFCQFGELLFGGDEVIYHHRLWRRVTLAKAGSNLLHFGEKHLKNKFPYRKFYVTMQNEKNSYYGEEILCLAERKRKRIRKAHRI